MKSASEIASIEERLELLSKPVWNYLEIMKYFGYSSSSSACNIKKWAIQQYGGKVRFGTHVATVDSILQCFGTTREKEVSILSKLNAIPTKEVRDSEKTRC